MAAAGCASTAPASTSPPQTSAASTDVAKTVTSVAVAPSTTTIPVGATAQLTASATYSDGSVADVTSTASWTSTDAATVSPSGMVKAIVAGSATVTATVSGTSASAQIIVSQAAKTLASIAVSSPTASVPIGATQQLTATATYSDGSTANVSATASWASSNAAVVSVSSSGLATGAAAGSATVTAALSGVSGSAQVTVPAPAVVRTLTSLTLAPSTATVAVGAKQQFAATATYSDGSIADVTAAASWTSSKAAVAGVSSSGLATGIAAGSASVTAALNGVSGSAQVAVPAPAVVRTLTSLALSPSTATVAVGAKQQFAATATYNDGSTADVTSTASWTSSKAAVVSVSSSGLATGVAAGSATVTAALSGVSGSAQVTVPAPAVVRTLTSLALSPSTATVAVGAKQQFAATGTYNDGSTADVTAAASWTSSKAAVAGVSSSGLATGVAAGSASVTAALNGMTGSAQITVPSPSKAAISIALSPSAPSFQVGATQQFTAAATYNDGSTGDVTATASWTSSNPAIATVSSSGLATGVTAGSITITAAVSGISGIAMLNVTGKTVTAIAISPNPATVALGATQQFAATATYKDGSTDDVSSTVTWAAGNGSVAAISSTGLATPAASGSTTITASLDGVSASDPLMVAIAPNTGVNIATWQSDAQRSGLNAGEKSLSPSNVGAQTFGKLFSYQMDGYEYGEPLLVSNITIGAAARNVVYAATEHDSVYAFDADNYGNGAPLWQVSLLQTGEAPMTDGPIQPYQGISSTPVIDAASNTIYVVSAQKPASGSATFRLNALDLTTGAQKFGGPVTIQASVLGTNGDAVNGMVSLTTSCLQRAALLLANGTVYIGFGGCHSGWLLAYDAHSLAQTGAFNASPNLNGEGAYASAGGIWMGGGGPAADSSGNIYVATGNGPWDGHTAWSDSALKFSAQLQLEDSFTPQDYAYMNCNDADLAAGGLLLIPGASQALVGGKTGKLYLLNTANLGQEQTNDAGAAQTLFFESDLAAPYSQTCNDSSGAHTTNINSYEIFGTAAYFNGSVYLGVTPTGANVPGGIRQFTLSSGLLTPYNHTSPSILQGSYGTTPFISANGTGNGVLWMIDHGQPLQNSQGPASAATLRAYDANNLANELYNSGTNAGDTPGYGIKFTSPIVANGKVYISTGHDPVATSNPRGELDVYGLK